MIQQQSWFKPSTLSSALLTVCLHIHISRSTLTQVICGSAAVSARVPPDNHRYHHHHDQIIIISTTHLLTTPMSNTGKLPSTLLSPSLRHVISASGLASTCISIESSSSLSSSCCSSSPRTSATRCPRPPPRARPPSWRPSRWEGLENI